MPGGDAAAMAAAAVAAAAHTRRCERLVRKQRISYSDKYRDVEEEEEEEDDDDDEGEEEAENGTHKKRCATRPASSRHAGDFRGTCEI